MKTENERALDRLDFETYGDDSYTMRTAYTLKDEHGNVLCLGIMSEGGVRITLYPDGTWSSSPSYIKQVDFNMSHVQDGTVIHMRNGDHCPLDLNIRTGEYTLLHKGVPVMVPTKSRHVIACVIYSYPNLECV